MSEPVPDFHAHKCRDCGNKWSHYKARGVTDAEYEELHRCTQCGRVEYYQHLDMLDRMSPEKVKIILQLRDEMDVFFGRGNAI